MPRLPFDPSRMAARASPATPPPSAPADGLTVTQLAALISGALRDRLPQRLRVIGEVSTFHDRTHWYFDLKDAGAVINCVMFASGAAKAGFRPEPGQQVVVTGHVEFFARQGRTQFYAEKIEPIGAGALDLAFRRLCEELRALGWFDESRKRPLPVLPRRIAVVTSRTGAALQDVLDTMRRRCPAIGVLIADVHVQGEGSAAEVAAAINRISRQHARLGVDALLVTRGGGSKEDLWTFNERTVAEAIVTCAIPVVAAIGHETDTTIAELVADLRCATPTQAAMRLTPDSAALLEQLDSSADRLGSLLRRRIRHEYERLRAAARHPFFTAPAQTIGRAAEGLGHASRRLGAALRERLWAASHAVERRSAQLERYRPAAVYAQRQARLHGLAGTLRAAMTARLSAADAEAPHARLTHACALALERRWTRLTAADRELELVGPMSVLKRGYSCTLRPDGSVVRSVRDVASGDPINTRVADGSFTSVVTDQPADPPPRAVTPAPPSPKPQRSTKPSAGIPDQPGLFPSAP